MKILDTEQSQTATLLDDQAIKIVGAMKLYEFQSITRSDLIRMNRAVQHKGYSFNINSQAPNNPGAGNINRTRTTIREALNGIGGGSSGA